MSAQRFLGVLVAFAMAAYFAFTALRSNGDVTGRKAEWILVCLKPVPCLCFALLCRTWSTQGAITTNFVMIGLLFGALGDVLLSVPGSPQFDAGLGAFLIGHLWYIAAFSKSSALAARAAIPWIVVAGCASATLLPGVESESIAQVTVYLIVEAGVGWRALALLTQPGPGSGFTRDGAWVALMGSSMFMVSDGILSINRFLATVPRGTYSVMVTYWLAQGLIALSLAKAPARAASEAWHPALCPVSRRPNPLGHALNA